MIFLGNNFYFKDRIPKDLTPGIVYKFQCRLCNEFYYGECVRHLNVRIGISPLTKKQVKPNDGSVADHLLFCYHSVFYDDFSILTRENKFLLELKENLLIMKDKPSLNRNITSASLYLLAGPSNKIFVRILFVLIVATLFLMNRFFYLVMCKCMSTTVRVNGTLQFTFFLVITIVTSSDSLIVILLI